MIGFRPCARPALCLALAAVLSGCSDSDSSPAAPTPTPTPTPTPAPTFTVSGTVSETAPTTGTRVEGVQVTVAGATVSTTTNAAGVFTLAGVPGGSQTLSFSKANFVTQTRAINVANANVSDIQVSLASTPRIVSEEHEAEIRGDDHPCFGTSRACDVYKVGAHNPGQIEAFIVWQSSDSKFDLELRCGGEVVDESIDKGDGQVREIKVDVKGGQLCELNVLYSGEGDKYGLFLKYPY